MNDKEDDYTRLLVFGIYCLAIGLVIGMLIGSRWP